MQLANRLLRHPASQAGVWLLGLLPLASLVWRAIQGDLGANPAEALIRGSGDWALRMLWLCLCVSPLRSWLQMPLLLVLRRPLGLLAFTYAVMHLLAYLSLDLGWDAGAWLDDLLKRPFILAGSAAALGMLPLALSSSNRAIRAMGAARWTRLHRLVYACAGLALLHFVWMRAGKNDFAEPMVYGALLAVLMGWRVHRWWRRRRPLSG